MNSMVSPLISMLGLFCCCDRRSPIKDPPPLEHSTSAPAAATTATPAPAPMANSSGRPAASSLPAGGDSTCCGMETFDKWARGFCTSTAAAAAASAGGMARGGLGELPSVIASVNNNLQNSAAAVNPPGKVRSLAFEACPTDMITVIKAGGMG